MMLSTLAMAGAALIICSAYTVYGLTGFGSSITAMPLVVLLMPLHVALPVMLVFDLCAGVLVGLRNHRSADRRELVRLVPYLVVGMGLGVTVLVHVPESVLLLVLGVFILAYCAWSLLVRPSEKLIATGWSAAYGIGGGVFTSLFGTGGPLYTIYLSRRLPDKVALRATISLLVLIAGVLRLALFSSVGLYNQSGLFQLIVLLWPFSLVGLFIGTYLHHRVEPKRVMQVVWVVLIVGGLSLVRKALQH